MSVCAEITFNEGGYWYSISLEPAQYMKLLQTGSLPDGKSVASVKLFDFPDEEGVSLIYDFVLARRGSTPWRQFPAVNV